MIHTAEEHFEVKRYYNKWMEELNDYEKSLIIDMIKDAQREAIEASAEVAKVRIKEERLCQMPTGSQFKTTPVYIPFYEVNKQSILNLLDQIK